MRKHKAVFGLGAGALALVTLASIVPEVAAQFTQVPPDPSMPVVDGFDTERALFWAEPNFVPFRDPEWESLRGARRANSVAADTPVIVFEVGGQTLVFVTSQMSYHHVAQGEMAGEPWMVTF